MMSIPSNMITKYKPPPKKPILWKALLVFAAPSMPIHIPNTATRALFTNAYESILMAISSRGLMASGSSKARENMAVPKKNTARIPLPDIPFIIFFHPKTLFTY
jgi:hypothetical protein